MKNQFVAACAAITLCTGSAVAAAAEADDNAVQVYGELRLSVDNNSDDFGDGKKGTSISSNSSRLGVKGRMPTTLEGIDLFYQAEMQYGAAADVNQEVKWREGYAGLKGGFGSIRLGRLSTAYKSTLTKIDPWNDNIPQSRGASGTQGSSALHSSYFNNAVDYVTPSFGGLTASIWAASEFDNSTAMLHNAGPLTNYTGGTATGFGLRYAKGALFASADIIDMNADQVGSANMDNGNGSQLALRYAFSDNLSAALFYEDVEDLGLGKNTYANGIYKVGKMRWIATYGTNRDATQFSDDSDTWSVGGKFGLTKKSELLAAYNARKVGDKEFNSITLGVNAKFGY